MAYTQSDIDALEAVLKTGAMIVEYEGPPRRKVQYQTRGEMQHQLALMRAEVNATTRQRFRFATHNKGFSDSE